MVNAVAFHDWVIFLKIELQRQQAIVDSPDLFPRRDYQPYSRPAPTSMLPNQVLSFQQHAQTQSFQKSSGLSYNVSGSSGEYSSSEFEMSLPQASLDQQVCNPSSSSFIRSDSVPQNPVPHFDYQRSNSFPQQSQVLRKTEKNFSDSFESLSGSHKSPEYMAVKRCTSELELALQQCIPRVTSACLSKDLISEDIMQHMHTNVSDSEKASRLLSCVRRSIMNDGAKFSAFIEVLGKEQYLDAVKIQLLQECVSKGSIRFFVLYLDMISHEKTFFSNL